MRKLPTYIAALFLTVTLWRVAGFAGELLKADGLGWVFAIGLGAAIYLSAYHDREHITIKDGREEDRRSSNTRKSAKKNLVFFLLVDGFFNLAKSLLDVIPPDTVFTIWLQYSGAVIYGVFPTIAAALLGELQGYVDRLPYVERKNILKVLETHLMKKIEAATLTETNVKIIGRNKQGHKKIDTKKDVKDIVSIDDFDVYTDVKKTSPQWSILRALVWQRDGRKCKHCEKDLSTETFHCHHVIPEAAGGLGNPSNLVTLCHSCHGKEHNTGDFFELANISKGRSKKRNIDIFLDILSSSPGKSMTNVAREMNVSRQTIYNYIDTLKEQGRISVNGNGVEIL